MPIFEPKRKFDLNENKWDQSTYLGRAKHFFKQTDPRNIFISREKLKESERIIKAIKNGQSFPEYTDDQLWDLKYLYDSAFHSETGQEQFILGRMSAQVPCNTFLVFGLLASYKSPYGSLFFQWLNQTFNSLVNYTNRSGNQHGSNTSILTSYVGAVTGSLGCTILLNRITRKSRSIIQRLVPFTSIAAANFINIGLMRSRELVEGIPVYDSNSKVVGNSQIAASYAVGSVIISRVVMSSPGLIITPTIVNSLVSRGLLNQNSVKGVLLQVFLCAFILTLSTPMCCAIFPQTLSIQASKLEPEIFEAVKSERDEVKFVHFNKGL